MSRDSECFVCGVLFMVGLMLIVVVPLTHCLCTQEFSDGYEQGKKEGYKAGYIMSLVNQEKGTPHDFILEEKDNGEFVWIENKEGRWE